MTRLITVALLPFLFPFLISSTSVNDKVKSKPNVVLIISDQWSAHVANGLGNIDNVIKTPGIDQLASEGITFTQSYSNFPLCSPARASIFTGLYPHNHKIQRNEEYYKRMNIPLPDQTAVATMGSEFKKAGYETAYFGKEHAAKFAYQGIDNLGTFMHSSGGMLAEGSAYDQIFTKDAIEFIKKIHEKPFYMTLSFINPHDICKVLAGKFNGATFADAINFCRNDEELYLRFEKRPDLPLNFYSPYIKGMIRDKDFMYLDTWNNNEDEWKRLIAAYYLLIEKTDWYIKLILDALAESGLSENTIVMFTTDHGEMLGSHKLIAKTTFYEESVKTMMIIRYPGMIEPGKVDDKSFIGSIDIMPTLLDLSEIKIPKSLDGKSFKAKILGNDSDDNFSVLFAENTFGRMLRFNTYKYVKTNVYGEDFEILVDLEKDPMETENVFGQKGYEPVSVALQQKLNEFIRDKDLIDKSN